MGDIYAENHQNDPYDPPNGRTPLDDLERRQRMSPPACFYTQVPRDALAALLRVVDAAQELRREFDNLYDGPEHPLNSLAGEMNAIGEALRPLLTERE